MSWLAMGPFAVAVVWLVAAALALWLYLHQRPLRRRVSTLRFWENLPPSPYRRRRWLREPWAFLIQALFLLLVIMALADPRWGVVSESRKVVLVLDTSVWSQVQTQGQPSWMNEVRGQAVRLLDSLPSSDPVLLLRSEADATPILPFSRDRIALRRAIGQVRASSAMPDLPRALEAGRAALAGAQGGLLVYIGPGMLDEEQGRRFDKFREDLEPGNGTGERPQLLVRLVGGDTPIENHGITRLALQRDEVQPDHWHLLTQVKNYGAEEAATAVTLSVNGQRLGQRSVRLAPGEVTSLHDEFSWAQGGLLQAELTPADSLEADNRATVYVPPFRPIQLDVFTARSSFEIELRTVLSSNSYWRTQFVRPGKNPAGVPDVAIYDGVSPPSQPAYNSIYFVRGQTSKASRVIRLTNWNPQHPVTRWVRTRDVSVHNPATLAVQPTDTVLASAESSPTVPLMLAREQGGRKVLIVGFDPRDSNLPQQSAFPLLMAGVMEWMTHTVEDAAVSQSAGELDLPGPITRIVGPSGREVPFARYGGDVHLIALETGLYRVIGPNGETSFGVNVPPLLSSQRLKVTSQESAPAAPETAPNTGRYLWRWLVVLAMIAVWLEWWLFYSERVNRNVSDNREVPDDSPSHGTAQPSIPKIETRDSNVVT